MRPLKTFERILEPGWLEAFRKSGRGLTERELIDRSFAFANSGSVKCFVNFTEQLDIKFPDNVGEPPASDGIKGTQDRFKAALQAIIDDKVTSERQQEWRAIADGVLQIETATGSGAYRYLEVVHFSGSEPSGLFALVLTWLMDPARRFKSELCRCRYRECRKFIWESKANGQGKRRRAYCSAPRDSKKDHMRLEANARRVEQKKKERRLKRTAKHK